MNLRSLIFQVQLPHKAKKLHNQKIIDQNSIYENSSRNKISKLLEKLVEGRKNISLKYAIILIRHSGK